MSDTTPPKKATKLPNPAGGYPEPRLGKRQPAQLPPKPLLIQRGQDLASIADQMRGAFA